MRELFCTSLYAENDPPGFNHKGFFTGKPRHGHAVFTHYVNPVTSPCLSTRSKPTSQGHCLKVLIMAHNYLRSHVKHPPCTEHPSPYSFLHRVEKECIKAHSVTGC